jgi:hypothetical protein
MVCSSKNCHYFREWFITCDKKVTVPCQNEIMTSKRRMDGQLEQMSGVVKDTQVYLFKLLR